MKSGIYKIVNQVNNKCYIGSTNDLDRRKKEHFRLLKQGKSHSVVLQRAVDKYGIDNFVYEVLCCCKEDYLYGIEQFFVDKLCPEYNQCLEIVSCPKGYKHTKETKQRFAQLAKERHKNIPEFGFKKAIEKLDENDNVIKYYNSLKEYAEEHNCSIASVSKALSKGHKCKGFKIREKPISL